MRQQNDTIFCVASGPSLTPEDCALIEATGCRVIAVNNTWRLFNAPYALYAGDLGWWKEYSSQVPRGRFRLFCANKVVSGMFGLEYRRYIERGEGFNSGAMAISLAAEMGALRIILVGYDCSLKHGAHWHGSHSGQLKDPTEASPGKWQVHFRREREKHKDLTILNASRRTELQCFPLITLEEAIAALS